ncbi:methyl-CpG-binding domain protein 6 isoform X2 [Lepisosteus oculatus]|uniref:methyl-CpG-binding domain protein 6 isoform X2 n=1 Tax=Lepisosteus oculatus TaxID=7918 RepID=UPI0035F50985
MTGGSESGGGDQDGGTPTAHVPIGWQRMLEGGAVVYISPSGAVLSSGDEVRAYLLTDGTCKCGLECPLVLHKVFNFDPGAAVWPRSSQEVKAEEDMTKLCNHRRKVVAMAALCRSMEVSQLALPAPPPGGALNHLESPVPTQYRVPQGSQIKTELRAERAGGGLGVAALPAGREEGGPCTYSRQQRSSSQPTPPASPSLGTAGAGNPARHPSLLFPSNGSRALANARLSPELGIKTHMPSPARSPYSCFSGSAQTPRYPRPPTPQNRTPEPPSSPRIGPYSVDGHVSSALASLAHGQGGRPLPPEVPCGGGSNAPHNPPSLSSSLPPAQAAPSFHSGSPSPAGSLDAPSPQRSRHYSASEAGLAFAGAPQPSARPFSAHSPTPGGSPKFSLLPASPKSRLEGMLQQYKDSAGHDLYPQHQSNQSQFQLPPLPPFPPSSPAPERRNGQQVSAASPGPGGSGLLGLPAGQLLQQHQHHAASFPASSLLSAAAKAQLASQKSQGHAYSQGREAPPKVPISTLQSRPPASRSPGALLVPLAPRTPPAPPDKSSRHKRQRRSPTVLSMLKESHLNSLRAGAELPPSPAERGPPHLHPPPPPASENHLHHPAQAPPAQAAPFSAFPRLPEAQDPQRRSGTLGAAAPQPLSALLHLLSVQSTQAASQPPSGTAACGPALSRTPPAPAGFGSGPAHSQSQAAWPAPATCQSHSQHASQLHGQSYHHPQSQSQSQPVMPGLDRSSPSPSAQALTLMSIGVSDSGSLGLSQGEAANVGSNPNALPGQNPLFTLHPNPGGGPDVGSQLLGLLGHPSSSSAAPAGGPCSGTGGSVPRMGAGEALPAGASTNGAGGQTVQASQGSPGIKTPPASSPGPGLLPLAESFPFMSQEQLLQLLSASSGLPSLLGPPFLGSLPLSLWMSGGGQQTQQQPQQQQQQQPQQGLLNQSSQLNLLPSMLGPQGEVPLGLLGLLNPPPAPGEQGDKLGPQALLTASLLLGQHQAAMLPLAGLGNLNLELLLQQQQLPPLQDGPGAAQPQPMEKAPVLEALLSGAAPVEGLQGLSPAEGPLQALQSLLLPTPPLAPAFLSLSPALLAAALGAADAQALPPHTQVTSPSSALASTSVSSTCTTTAPSSGAEGADALLPGPGKTSPLPPQLLTPLLGNGVLGDLSALGSGSLALNNLQAMLGAGPLLLPPLQAPTLGMPLIQGQAAGLNPMACLLNSLQLNMGPTLPVGGDKPINSSGQTSDNTSPAPLEEAPANQLAQDSLTNSGHAPGSQQRSGPLDPYSSFMETIYTSFLQVTGKKASDGGPCGGQSGAPSALPPSPSPYPQVPGDTMPPLPQNSGPPSLSPRRACTLRNQDLSRLGMEAAQSPARGTPKLSEDGSTPPPPGAAHKAGAGGVHCDPPLGPAFPAALEEAKTDSSACPYSNGVPPDCAGEMEGVSEEMSESPQAQAMYPNPGEGMNGTALCPSTQEGHSLGLVGAQEVMGQAVRTGGARRGRKRKQALQKLPSDLREAESVNTGDHGTMVVHQKPERSVKSKRRRVIR